MPISKITRIVDLHKKNGVRPAYDDYMGRMIPWGSTHNEFPKNSIWANPYTFKEYGKDALKRFEIHILWKIHTQPKIYDLESLRGKTLGCWCTNTESFEPPLVCHVQIILRLLAEPKSQLIQVMSMIDWLKANCRTCQHRSKHKNTSPLFGMCLNAHTKGDPRDHIVLIAHDHLIAEKARCDHYCPESAPQ